MNRIVQWIAIAIWGLNSLLVAIGFFEVGIVIGKISLLMDPATACSLIGEVIK